MPGDKPNQVGNKTECALLGFLSTLGCSYEDLRHKNPESGFVKVYTFSSTRKSMSTIMHPPIEDRGSSKWLLLTKGAAEIVISK